MISGDVALYYVKCLLFNKNTVGSVYLRIFASSGSNKHDQKYKKFLLYWTHTDFFLSLFPKQHSVINSSIMLYFICNFNLKFSGAFADNFKVVGCRQMLCQFI